MNRRDTIVALIALGATPDMAAAQQAGKTWRIGFLTGVPRPANGLPPAPLRDCLAELGYKVGNNLSFESRWAEARFERLPVLAAEIVQSRVDAIVATGWQPALAVKRATSTIPIVVINVGDAVQSGLTASLSKPEANLTGVSDMEVELSAKRLQILKDSFPKVARLAILWNQDDVGMTLRYNRIGEAAQAMGIAIQGHGLRSPEDIDAALAAMKRDRPDAIFVVADGLTATYRRRVIDFAAEQRIPGMYEFAGIPQEGGLMSYGASPEDSFRRVAYFIDRILRGAKPGDLPMEQPTRYYLTINLKTARALGIVIPPDVLLRADRVIE
jgi:putative ABC transport system substrate-binding protein